ncbi:FAD-binding oxidoreductase [Denitrificimonas sp. JX-1]|uniref:FAD-binding oxidoreductase n=1 Tax=Denitrificimonas halotolerans TaxID=3098930 RepID=A0ABU5GP65_9GAMM|nr:FAD-binding oxidoreductase [Denitrificimonas sp. JX-1]MDY7218337.1 FAD-binding oxidoreductase [Denitrificimonas sp. JX-1]
MSMSSHSDIVVIGGGILGCSIASYLSQQTGLKITVVERTGLAEQTTSQAAGLLTRIRSSKALTVLAMETFAAIDQLAEHTGESLPLQRVGSLQVAASEQGLQQLNRLVTQAAAFAQNSEWLQPADAEQLAPWLSLTEQTRALYLPDDGYIDPYALCMAYARAARNRGVVFRLYQEVTSVLNEADKVYGVQLASGEILHAGLVIDAAGPWSTALARQQGVNLAMAPVRSHYWISAYHAQVLRGAPMTIFPDSGSYARPEVGGLLFGMRDKNAVTAHPSDLPNNLQGFSFATDANGDEALADGYVALQQQCSLLDELDLAHYISSVSSYTPDNIPLIGAMPGVEGFFAATGCSGAGVGLSGGIGRLVADLATGCTPFIDPAAFRLDRFGAVDSFDPDFIQRCAAARARKRSG